VFAYGEDPMTRVRTVAAAGLAATAAALALLAGASRGAAHAAPAPPTDRQVAQRTISRYIGFLDSGRGAAFCNDSITATTLRAEGGADRCMATIDGYVKRVEQQGWAQALQSMHYLFMQLSDGIVSNCATGRACPSSEFGRWAMKTYPGEVDWLTGTNPSLASSTGAKVVAVVDPTASSRRRITLYYQAWDGRIFRASWSTTLGSWRGSVVDTHRGTPFLSNIRVLHTTRTGDELIADVGMTIGTLTRTEVFALVREAGSWRVDTWHPLAGPPAV
jgi:hypothetical protein